VFLASVLVSFAGGIRGGNLIYNICTAWADAWFLLTGICISYIYEAPREDSKPYIYVANHISYLDAAIIVKAIRKPLRPLGKAELGNIPVFGFIYRRAVVMVDRSSSKKRAESIGRMKAVLRYQPSWLNK
jgi:1-acyl-sn-glycerol-3-phosphate acyltransferase